MMHLSQHVQQQQHQEPAQAYEILWGLADHYLKTTAAIVANSHIPEETRTTLAGANVLTAIRCLEAILLSGVLSVRVEVRTRVLLAQILLWYCVNRSDAETHLQKATLLVQKTSDPTLNGLRFLMKDLQYKLLCESSKSALMVKPAKVLLKQACTEARAFNEYAWYYHFMQRRAELSINTNDTQAGLVILKEAVEVTDQRGDVEMKAALLILLVLYSLADSANAMASEAVAQLIPLFQSDGEALPINSSPILTIYYHLIHIPFLLRKGDVNEALQSLLKVQALAECNQNISHDGLTKIRIRRENGLEDVTLRLLGRSELFAFIFLISGVVHKSGDSYKSKRHLVEGLKLVNAELSASATPDSVPQLSQRRHWLSELKVIILRHQTEVCLLRGELCESLQCLRRLSQWAASTLPLQQRYSGLVALDWGMFCLTLGRWEQADQWFMAVERHQDNNIAAGQSLTMISQAHRILLYLTVLNKRAAGLQLLSAQQDSIGLRTLDDADTSDASPFQAYPHTAVAHIAICHYLSSISHLTSERSTIRGTKLHILQSIKHSEPLQASLLKYLSLSILGTFFHFTNLPQAKKIYQAAFALASRSRGERWCGTLTGLIADACEENSVDEIAVWRGKRREYEANVKEEYARVLEMLNEYNQEELHSTEGGPPVVPVTPLPQQSLAQIPRA
ncbi:cohesin loading factor [Gaertneriomyces semiglobifer]|nr:cohesin loading factor [Gaertneriomyces semiglobifer]